MGENRIDKKGLKKKYKETLQPMGIFQIKNLVNGKIFIGSGKNIRGILNSQAFQLKSGSHMNKELQKDFTISGEGNFSFTILDYLNPNDDPDYDYTEDLKVLLDMWLLKLQPYGEKGYHTACTK